MVDEHHLAARLREATYAAVGLGVIGAQRLAVRRRELAKQMEPRVREAAARAQELAAAGDEVVNPVLDRMEAGIPGAPRAVVRAARAFATQARDSMLEQVARGPGGPVAGGKGSERAP